MELLGGTCQKQRTKQQEAFMNMKKKKKNNQQQLPLCHKIVTLLNEAYYAQTERFPEEMAKLFAIAHKKNTILKITHAVACFYVHSSFL